MGRAPITCKHGIRGISNCKTCQREQHTERVRKLREKRKRLEEQEKALEKKWNQENVKVFMNDSEKAEKEPSTAKHIIQGSRALEDTSQIPVSCGTCAKQESCKSSVFYRTYRNAGKCPNWQLHPILKAKEVRT